MKFIKQITVILTIALITGCAGGLNSMQKREYAAFKNDGVLIEEKDPTLGAALGLLPGFGSFYVRETGYGILNLLAWPASVLWDPVSGYDGAMTINYDMTKYHLNREKEKELSELSDQFALGQIEKKEYILAKRKVEQKYTY